ncbi:MAG: GNAT family N-acetyltransferase [Deltaproteobacteria bacterium]|nr:MAG: GNAT family N-acetyltransferase [Deltaproteobacteria bacterium]
MAFGARGAGGEDLPALLEMMEDFNAGESIAFDRALFRPRLERLLADPGLGRVLVFEVDGDPSGYAIVTWGYDLEYGGRDAFLTEFYVRPDHRRRGIGRQALAAAEEAARSGGAHALHLLVRHENAEAQRLYGLAGYRTEPRAVMTKDF